MVPDVRSQHGTAVTDDAEPAAVLLLVSDDGNRGVLETWLEDSTAYEPVQPRDDLEALDVDCCVICVEHLQKRLADIEAMKERSEHYLPCLLLVSQKRIEAVEDELARGSASDVAPLVDGILRAPISLLELDNRLQTLLRVRRLTSTKDRQADLLSTRNDQLELLNGVLRHDIRNDVTVILGYAAALAEQAGDSTTEKLDRIRDAGDHIVELTEVASELVESQFSEGSVELAPVQLATVLTEEVENRQDTFDDATITMVDQPPVATVMANGMLSSVFRNLINNAVQHNDVAEPTVEISADRQDGWVQVRVADDGPGIPDSVAGSLYASETKGLDSEGTGLGLSLVERLVEIYGGDVRMEPAEPRGTVFEVELPIAEGGG
jgi:signal transduction histidine kinase